MIAWVLVVFRFPETGAESASALRTGILSESGGPGRNEMDVEGAFVAEVFR